MTIAQLAGEIGATYAQDEQSGNGALFDAAAEAYSSGALQSGDLEQLLEIAGTAAGVAICAGAGAAALAPLCAAAGKTAGDLVSTFFGGGARPSSSDGSDPHPWAELFSGKDKALASVLNASGGDLDVSKQLRKLVQTFYPFSFVTEGGKQFARLDLEPGVPYTALPLAGGYIFPFMPAYWLSPLDFKEELNQYGDKIKVLKRESGWVDRLVWGLLVPMRLGTTLQLDAVAQAVKGDLGPNPAGGADEVLQRLRLYLYPVLEGEFKRRASAILQAGKLQRQARLVRQLEETTAELQKIHGWSESEAREAAHELVLTIQTGDAVLIQQAVSELSTSFASQVSDAASKGFFAPKFNVTAATTLAAPQRAPSPWRWVAIGAGTLLTAAGGLVAWRVSKKKPPLPPSLRYPLR